MVWVRPVAVWEAAVFFLGSRHDLVRFLISDTSKAPFPIMGKAMKKAAAPAPAMKKAMRRATKAMNK